MLICAAGLLAACAPQGATRDRPYQTAGQPGLPPLGDALPAGQTAYSNESLADLFVHLTHGLEWGANRPHLVRYEAPVRVAVSGSGRIDYAAFLDRFLASLRNGAGIDIAMVPAPSGDAAANLLIRFVPGNALRATVPQHTCVVAPGRLDWAEFRRDPVAFGTRAFETAARIDAMTVFLPDNVAPWLVRVCLIEEVTQALGPANDLYGLGPSIFNDDAAHVWPTALDHLMLRVLYQPEMRTGLGRNPTRNTARKLLARLNPAGETAPPLPPLRIRQMRDWAETLRKAFDRDTSDATRLRAARAALTMARTRAPGSAHHCHSLSVLAGMIRDDPAARLRTLGQAQAVCRRAHGPGLRTARLTLEQARATFRDGAPGAAYGLTEGLETALSGHGLGERLVALYALQAASLRAIQQPEQAARVRDKAAAWAAYALGRDHRVTGQLTANREGP